MTEKQFEELKELLQKNIALATENVKMSKRLRHYQILSSVWGWTKLALLIATIMAGLIYVPRWAQQKLAEINAGIGKGGPAFILEKFGLDRYFEEESGAVGKKSRTY